MFGYIYITTNHITNKQYVGQKKSPVFKDICIKNLKHSDTEVQRKRSIISNVLQEKKIDLTEECLTKRKYRETYLHKKYPSLQVTRKTVIDLKDPIPVYDLEVDGLYPNFKLATGNFVHNCPGGGKSRIKAFLTVQALKDFKKVVFITLELSEAETMANINTAITGLGIKDMLDPAQKHEFEEKLLTFKNTYNPELVVKFYKPNAITTDTIHNYIQKVIQHKEETTGMKWKPDVIYIDYLDKLLPTQKVKGNMYEDVGGVATDCKNLGISFDCPVISGSQLGRYTWVLNGDAVVSMDSIAESAQKVHICHSMTTINSNKNEKEVNKARLFLAKSRSGSPGKVIYVDNLLGQCKVVETEPWDPNTLISTSTYTIKDSNSKK